jgi:hypothetical protein
MSQPDGKHPVSVAGVVVSDDGQGILQAASFDA